MFIWIKNFINRKKIKTYRRWRLIFWITLLLIIFILLSIYNINFGKDKNIQWGVTYSHKYATELGLDWQQTYNNILDGLDVKLVRLMAYWDSIEPTPGQYDYSKIDWLIKRATNQDVKIILTIGRRQPRWPECHQPDWVDDFGLLAQQQAELTMLEEVVNHFKTYDNIVAWQVDNEPFLSVFGECPIISKQFYKQKINLVKELDDRDVITTDSGELSTWLKTGKLVDKFGVSVYRNTWNKWYGKFYYPLPPSYYYIKTKIVKLLTPVDDIFLSELQLEPWSKQPITKTSLKQQYESMNMESFEKNIIYAKKTGFDTILLWGVEWWYYMMTQHNDPNFWNYAEKIINNDK